jgi:hypothetical protein
MLSLPRAYKAMNEVKWKFDEALFYRINRQCSQSLDQRRSARIASLTCILLLGVDLDLGSIKVL